MVMMMKAPAGSMQTDISMHDSDYIQERVSALYRLHSNSSKQRSVIRAIMSGGRETVEAVFGSDTKLKDQHLPAANMVHAGMSRLGQQIGAVPTIKSNPPPGRDSDRARDHAQLLGQIVAEYDESSELDIKLPRLGRWTAGYGFGFAYVSSGWDPFTQTWFPKVRIKSSYDVYPGFWSDDDEPDEVAVIRSVDPAALEKKYPVYKTRRAQNRYTGASRAMGGGVVLGQRNLAHSNFEGVGPDMVAIAQYFDITGQYLWVEDTGQLLDFSPNPLPIKNFVTPRRLDFDGTTGQWDHAIGLVMMSAKLNVLGFIATEDAVFAATNVIGDPTNTVLRRGRNAVNRFPAGTVVARDVNTANLQQTFAQIDRLERQLRIASNYPVSQDGQSPNSFATGQGIDRLANSADNNVREYQKVMGRAMVKLDAIRLYWDEALYSGMKKPLEARVSADSVTKFYDPKEIRGRYKVDRVYGVMAGWDDSSKIVGGLQLLAAKILDRRTFRENLDGMHNPDGVDDRIAEDSAFDSLMVMLEQQAQQGDPVSRDALVRMYRDPSSRRQILEELFVMEEQEQPALGPGAAPTPEGPPPDITTILSQLGQGGRVEGGAQTVSRI